MNGLQSILSGFLVSSSLIVTFSLFYALYTKGAPAVKPFVLICGTVAIYLFGYAMELASPTLDAMKAWNMVQYVGIPFIPGFWLWFALSYNEVRIVTHAWFRRAIFIVPVTIFLMRITNDFHHLYYSEMVLRTDRAFPVMVLGKAFFYYVYMAFVSACLVTSNLLFIRTARRQGKRWKAESRLLVTGSSFPWVAMILNGINFGNLGLDYSAMIYPVSCVMILFIVFQEHFLKLKPKARDLVFENTDDALLVFDMRGNLADFNPAASRILPGIQARLDAGPQDSAGSEEDTLAMLSAVTPGASCTQFPIRADDVEHHYNVSASSIVDESGRLLGKVIALNDITQITTTLQALAEKEEKLRTVTESISEAFWLRSAETGRFLYVSPAYEKIWGRSVAELYDDPGIFLGSTYSDDRDRVTARFESDRSSEIFDIEFRIVHGNGEIRWVWVRSSPVRGKDGAVAQHAGIGVDITERRRMEERIQSDEKTLDAINRATTELLINRNLPLAISGGLALVGEATGADRVQLFENNWRGNPEHSVTSLNSEWNSGRFSAQIGSPLMQNLPMDLIGPMIDELSEGRVFKGLVSGMPEGTLRSILREQSIQSVLRLPIFANNSLWGFIGFDECKYPRIWTDADVSLLSTFASSIAKAVERSIYEKKIEFMSFHDSLTGLFNRAYFDLALANPDIVDALPLTIVMADVNGLKLTNDAFGHASGDSLLCRAATVMSLECRSSDTIARTGGDEFVILLPKTNSREAAMIVGRIRARAEGFRTETGMLSISFGWETRAESSQSPDEILKAAEDAMYRQKLSESLSMRHSTISMIMKTLYAKNEREQRHSERVAELCERLGAALRMDQEKVRELRTAGLMHDIGKIGVADSILAKKEAPDEAEWTQLRRHPEIGYRILSLVNEYSQIASWVLAHHERWDGRGYPNGTAGSEIPLQARIVAIADAWDAMIYDRPYQAALPRERALEEMIRGAGGQFDPELLKVFLSLMKGGQD